jgi:Fur family ferric uptake transcriptional regulator
MDRTTDDIEVDIRGRGLRCTAQRVAVLSLLRAEPAHLRVEEVAEQARSRLGTVSTQAVYDVLAALTDAGLVRRIEPAGSPARFEARTESDHHHLVCRSCAAVADVELGAGDASRLEPASTRGYLVDETEIIFWGLCPACRPTPG